MVAGVRSCFPARFPRVESSKVMAGSWKCQGGSTCTWAFPKGTSLSLGLLSAQGFFFPILLPSFCQQEGG